MLSSMECMDIFKQSINNINLESDWLVSTTTESYDGLQNLDIPLLLDQEAGLNNLLPPCRVCGARSTGLHYGVISCEACKSFFRRSFKRKRKLRCSTGKGICIVRSEAKFCRYCRYQKCIITGMSKEAIKIGRYTYEQKTRNTLEVKGELIVDNSYSKQISVEALSSESKITFHHNFVGGIICQNVPVVVMDSFTLGSMDDGVADCARVEFEQMIEHLTDASERLNPYGSITQSQDILERKQTDYYELCSLKNNVFGNLFDLSPEEHEAFRQTTGIDLDERDMKMTNELDDVCWCTVSMIDFAKLIPGFREIDRAFCDYWLICSVKYVHKDYLVEATPSGRLYIWGELSFLITMEYQRELKLFIHAATKLSLSNETWAIIKAMTLTFPDRTLMKNPDQVERAQNTLIDCLLYSLSRHYERPQEILSKIINLFLIMRNMTELDSKYYQCNILRWPNIKRYPLIYELLSPKFD